MPPRPTVDVVEREVPGLGTVKGWLYDNGVSQYSGIPYARLAKRWTRSTLASSWEGNYHDGTKLGPSAPNPPEIEVDRPSILTPVPDFAHLPHPVESELECLVINISVPPSNLQGPFPVMFYLHGGAFVYGGANEPIFDGVNGVSFSVERQSPVVQVSINYRIGYGGFLASQDIKNDLEKDGFDGVGNFGLTDQQVALEWVQKYIQHFNGDKDNVTIYGLSAGGISVAYQMAASRPSVFHRAISMSGTMNTVGHWSLNKQEQRYQALLRHLGIEGPNSLEKLRALPEAVVAAATIPLEGHLVSSMNPCDDGVFLPFQSTIDTISSPPPWVKSFMIGDVSDEGIILWDKIKDFDYAFIKNTMSEHLDEKDVVHFLGLWNLTEDTPRESVLRTFEHICADAFFNIQDWIGAHKSEIPQTYAYHFDQVSTLDNALKGTAYHAIDLLYVFLNLTEEMSPAQLKLAHKVAGDYIDFAYGRDPFERFGEGHKWMVYGPDDEWQVKSEEEDELKRGYSRWRELQKAGLTHRWAKACGEVVNYHHPAWAKQN